MHNGLAAASNSLLGTGTHKLYFKRMAAHVTKFHPPKLNLLRNNGPMIQESAMHF